MEVFEPIHQHLLMKASVKRGDVDAEEGKQFLIDLVRIVGMVPVTSPQCVMVTFPGNEGPTGSINLATSHIAFHLWSTSKLLMLDVYSCKNFDPETVIRHVHEVFGLSSHETVVFDRETLRPLAAYSE
jgi:S-adenosylmethionine/arginine decarboxylase-like enzyme